MEDINFLSPTENGKWLIIIWQKIVIWIVIIFLLPNYGYQGDDILTQILISPKKWSGD